MKKILVIGDNMIDVYWYGDVTRLSQEAPVPVVKHQREECRAGAAANVAMNCRAMGADTSILSIVGDDEHQAALASILFDNNIRDYSIVGIESKTTRKLRIIGKQQQITRVDFDYAPPIDAVLNMHAASTSLIKEADIVVFSDYGKGAMAHIRAMIQYARSIGKTVLVDPKGHNYDKYRGADLIKPNIDEMREMVGGWDSEDELAEKVAVFMDRGDFGAVLLTRASAGMTLFRKGMKPYSLPSDARNVYDVTGAGDTSIAAFAVSLARGFDFEQATQYAIKASGIVVERFGTAVAYEQEVF